MRRAVEIKGKLVGRTFERAAATAASGHDDEAAKLLKAFLTESPTSQFAEAGRELLAEVEARIAARGEDKRWEEEARREEREREKDERERARKAASAKRQEKILEGFRKMLNEAAARNNEGLQSDAEGRSARASGYYRDAEEGIQTALERLQQLDREAATPAIRHEIAEVRGLLLDLWARVYQNWAVSLLMSGHVRSAYLKITKALMIDPKNVDTLRLRAMIVEHRLRLQTELGPTSAEPGYPAIQPRRAAASSINWEGSSPLTNSISAQVSPGAAAARAR